MANGVLDNSGEATECWQQTLDGGGSVSDWKLRKQIQKLSQESWLGKKNGRQTHIHLLPKHSSLKHKPYIISKAKPLSQEKRFNSFEKFSSLPVHKLKMLYL